jgi:heme exporter protein B
MILLFLPSMNAALTIWNLLKKDVLIEWRQKSALASMLIYVISTVFVIYFAFSGRMDVRIWVGIYWVILLFVVVNMTVRSFTEEANRQFYYLRSLAKPGEIMIAKLLYNGIYFIVLAGLTLLIISLFFGFGLEMKDRFLLVVLLGSLGLANMFTLLSAITSRIENAALTAILGFPIVIPLLLLSIRLSVKCADPVMAADFGSELLAVAVLDLLVIGLAVILFTYLWRD